MHWHILGAGAIGLLWAAKLTRAGHSTTLLLRNADKLAHYQRHGHICLEQDNRRFECSPAAELSSGDSAASRPIEHLLITTKAYAVVDAFNALQHRLSAHASILLLHNGLGPQQQLATQYPQLNLWAGSTTDGAYLAAPWHVVQAGAGETRIGALHATGKDDLYQQLHGLGDPLIHDTEIIPTLWRKLAINCAINPLTALHNCKNGTLVTTPDYLAQMAAICLEVEQVAARLNIPLFGTPLLEQATRVATLTANNNSSMQQDIYHQRPTEIETITGYLCQQARQVGLATPLNERLLQQIRQLSAASAR